MAGMGPPPKHPDQRARRNASISMTPLSAAGRSGRAPRWPLIDDVGLTAQRDLVKQNADAIEADLELNAELEEMTSAAVAKAQRSLTKLREEEFILNAKLKAQRKLEQALWRDIWKTPQATQWESLSWTRDVAQYVRHKVLAELGSLNDAKEARQMADRLGLTPLSLLRLRWEIIDDSANEQVQDGSTKPKSTKKYANLRVVG